MSNLGLAGDKRHAFAERGLDSYPTPPCAVEALLRAAEIPHVIWEPACGEGAIVKVLRASGRIVTASDIVDYGCPGQRVADFLATSGAPRGVEAIVTNPPFRLANEFAAHALDLVPDVYLLLRLAFCESVRRTPILENGRLREVLVFRNRLPRMHRDGWDGPRATSSVCFAWFHWSDKQGPTTLKRISWE